MKFSRFARNTAGRIVLWLLPVAMATSVLALILALRPGTVGAQGQDTDGDGMPDEWEIVYGVVLDPADPADAAYDPDGDGLSNLQEYLAGTLPHFADIDDDGLPDGWEIAYGLDPHFTNEADFDPDGDGLLNYEEYLHGTYPDNVDSDGDGLLDGWEVAYSLNPISGLSANLVGWWRFTETSGAAVSDWSGQGRDAEILSFEHVTRTANAPVGGALRFDGVSDDDFLGLGGYVWAPGLTNAPLAGGFTAAAWVRGDTLQNFATIVAKSSDHDSLPDGLALCFAGATPGAFVRNAEAIANNITGAPAATNQWIHLCLVYDGNCSAFYTNGELTSAVITNTIGTVTNNDALWIGTIYGQEDGLPWHGDIADVRLYTAALSSQDVADLLETYADPDSDGLCNLDEQTAGADPTDADTDDDGMPDGWEVAHGLDPLVYYDESGDNDSDGLNNSTEYPTGTDPTDPDTDDDGMPDGWEAAYGFNPLDSCDAAGDMDGDGLTNRAENTLGTHPGSPDTDGDGLPDGAEIDGGLDPNRMTTPVDVESLGLRVTLPGRR